MILIQQGKLKSDDLVSKHWPEFAANGKDKVTVEHLLLHTSGLIADNVIAVFPETDSCPIVCVGTLVTVCVVPLLKTSTSFDAGVVRVGVQLVLVAQEPPAAWFHVYVVCAKTLGPIRARQNAAARKTLVLFIDPPSAREAYGAKPIRRSATHARAPGAGRWLS